MNAGNPAQSQGGIDVSPSPTFPTILRDSPSESHQFSQQGVVQGNGNGDFPADKGDQEWYSAAMSEGPRLQVAFFRTETGREPVREWLLSLPRPERQIIGTDLLDVQYAWPLGMPLVRKLDTDLWEVRSTLGGRIARVLVTLEGTTLVAIHGFIKKSQRTPKEELDLAKKRLQTLRRRNT